MKMHLNKILKQSKINNNSKNRTAKLLSNMKKGKKNLMGTTRPLTKKIKMKS